MVTQEQKAELERLISELSDGRCRNGDVLAKCNELYKFIISTIEAAPDAEVDKTEAEFGARGLEVLVTVLEELRRPLGQIAGAFRLAATMQQTKDTVVSVPKEMLS